MALLCPVLIGRGDLLALGDRRVGEVAAGCGRLLLLAGEAGIGKTRLLAEIRSRAVAAGFVAHTVAAYPRDTAGGVLMDLAAELARAGDGSRIAERLRTFGAGDAYRQRRLLAADLADLVLALPAAAPMLVAIEDLHWADDLTLDVLDRVARRLPQVPLLIVGTYRSDELYPAVPARAWRTRLLTQRLAEEARLPRLTATETAAMAARITGAALPTALTTAVHTRSDGIPLHVEEFLPLVSAAHAVPDTLADAVLARAADLSPAARTLAGAASVIGRSFDVDLLTAITDEPPAAVDAALRELTDRFFVQPRAASAATGPSGVADTAPGVRAAPGPAASIRAGADLPAAVAVSAPAVRVGTDTAPDIVISATRDSASGVRGLADAASGARDSASGVRGLADATSGARDSASGVRGLADAGSGVLGFADGASGVLGFAGGASGVRGLADAAFDFRHSLIRDALHADLPPLRRRELHARVAVAAVAAGFGDAFVSDQYERAGRPADAHRHALAAAAAAAALSAHREAVGLLRRAQRTQPTGTPAAARADLLAALGAELAAVDDNAAAAAAYAEAIALRRSLHDNAGAAALVPPLAAARHALGAAFDERDRLLQDALALVPSTVDTSDVRARILAGLSAMHMLDRCLDESIDFGRQARALAGDLATRLNADTTLGAALVFGGSMDEGWRLMESMVDGAAGAGLEAEVSRGHRMIGCCASALVEYDRGLDWLRRGVAYAERIERLNDRHYMAAHIGHILWCTGDWDGATRWARQALADGSGDVGTRITALQVLGYVALGRADRDAACAHLSEARGLAEPMDELQRLSPALWGLAELAVHTGRFTEAVGWVERGWVASDPSWDAGYLFPHLVTGVRAHLALDDLTGARHWFDRCEQRLRYRSVPGTLPALDHAEGLLHLAAGHTGRARTALERASEGWDGRHRFWEGTQALLDLARVAHRSRRPADAAALSDEARRRATATGATVLLQSMPQLGTRGAAAHRVGSGATTGATGGPQRLTTRETEVARLVAAGSTNRQIAEALSISPKTVAAHVEHILTKLGAARRTEIAAWSATTRTSP